MPIFTYFNLKRHFKGFLRSDSCFTNNPWPEMLLPQMEKTFTVVLKNLKVAQALP